MKKKAFFLLLAAMLWSLNSLSQSVNPLAYYTDEKDLEQETTTISDGQAPLTVIFRANPSDMEGHNPSYEWHFRRMESEGHRELFVRYEEDTQYTFNESGTYNIVLKTQLMTDTVELDSVTITVAIAESKLEFPNAFSPNGDEFNNILKAKEDYQSIVSFQAAIFNRWGQKIYSWNKLDEGWDGRWNGHLVKDGVYFLVVNARGADGRKYNIRKAVNVITGYNNDAKGTTGEE